MTEKQASSEIAQSRERFCKFLVDQQWPFSRQTVIAAMEWAERDTRKRVANLVKLVLIQVTGPDGSMVNPAELEELLVERIRGKE